MKNRLWIAALVALGALPGAAHAAGAELNVIKSLQVGAGDGTAQVTIAGSKAPTFTVFRLSDPARVVVDLAGADVSAVRGTRPGAGAIAEVTASQFSDEQATVGRVVVALANDSRYDVKAEGTNVVVTVGGADAQPKAARARVEAPRAEPARPSVDDNVVVSRIDERKVARGATRVRDVKITRRGQATVVTLVADGEIGTYELLELKSPPRLAIDLHGVSRGPRAMKAPAGANIEEVRFGRHENKLRVVVDAHAPMPKYEITRVRRGLTVTLGETGPAAVAKAPPAEKAGKKAERRAAVAVRDVTFNGDETGGKVIISVGKGVDYSISRPDPRTAVLTLTGASIPKRLERSLDTSAFGGAVKMVSSFAAPGQPDTVQVVATLDGEARDRVIPSGSRLVWEFSSDAPARTAAAPEVLIDGKRIDIREEAATATSRTSGFASEAPAYASSSAPQKSKYTGRRVSFEFKDIDIHNLLRIIAEVSKRNIIVADNVSGRVTIRLRNVPWDQALDLILRSKGLDKEVMGNIIRIAPYKELEEERQTRLKMLEANRKLEPLKVRLIPVNYAQASSVAGKVKDLLTERGSISIDDRTNVIIVKDTTEALARAEGLVRRLDTQTPQVLIESRIVEANSSFTREFGIQWGGHVSMAPATGNPTGLLFPNVVRMTGASSAEGNLGTADIPNFAVNLPAPIGAGAGGGVGFIFGSAGGAVALNLRLTAMENAGHIKTISAPKVTTLDNTPATIGQGVSIPFSQVSAAGVNTTFVEAKLELKVTPHVTADGSVLMDIQATNNQPDPGITGANGQPSISKKEAKTQVLVKDGDTTVIGGIYTRSQASNEAAVPVLSKIPVLGWLFKKHREVDNRTELLIFITPRIVNRNQVVAATEGLVQ